ncbi:MAG: DUF975 family protein [bacterium]|nr:DUF975 family protein [Candidatus Limimorpha equi]
MITRKELRQQALDALSGKWTMPVLATLIYIAITAVPRILTNLGKPPYLFEPVTNAILITTGFILLIFLLPLEYGFGVSFLRFCKGNTLTVKEMFDASFGDYAKAFVRAFVTSFFVFLWTLLLIVPGFIKALAYSMTFFISDEHPEWTTLQCIDESERMMKGHKWELFLLILSFIGWFLLALLSLGIGFLWLRPYIHVTKAKFYEQLKLENCDEII